MGMRRDLCLSGEFVHGSVNEPKSRIFLVIGVNRKPFESVYDQIS